MVICIILCILKLIFFRGRPAAVVHWQHDANEVVFDKRIVRHHKNSLLITNTTSDDAGSWVVTAYNSIGVSRNKN